MDFRNVQVQTTQELWNLFSKNNLHSLYDDCFGDAKFDPVYGGEAFEVEEVASIFLNYLKNGILLFCINKNAEVVGFAGALPLIKETKVFDAVKSYLHDPFVYWYHADIGVHSNVRGQGVSKLILNDYLKIIPTDYVVMRARSDNITTIKLHKKYGFEFLNDSTGNKVLQKVFLNRKSGKLESDERLFLTLKK